MDIETLKKLLKDAGVPDSWYVLPPDTYPFTESAMALCILDSGGFEVFSFDRGERFDRKVFSSEHDACLWFLEDSYFAERYPKIRDFIKGTTE